MPAEYTAANGITGGSAYSEWFKVAGGGLGALTMYSYAGAPLTAGAEYVRCKTCHAWDGLGNAGSYSNRTGVSTGTAARPDISSVNLWSTAASSTPTELFDLIAHPQGRPINAALDSRHPDYTGYLTTSQIWNIVKFMKEEWINPNALYDLAVAGAPVHNEYPAGVKTVVLPTLTYSNLGKGGVEAAGLTAYAAKCQTCHGATGKEMGIPAGTTSLGNYMRTKPNEGWFKIKFGGPVGMNPGLVTSTQEMKDLYKLMANVTLFPD